MAKKGNNNVEMTGRVARLVAERGFGFIKPDGEREADHFFHMQTMDPKSQLSFAELREGDRVGFTSAESEKGPRAQNVRSL